MTNYSPNWPDGTPKSQRNAFDWRVTATSSMADENRKARLSRIARDSKDERLKPTEMNIYSKAKAAK